MKITIMSIGSRGDLQPALALGLGLKDAGHTVTLASHTPYADVITTHGLQFADIADDPQAMLEGELGQSWLETGRNPLTMLRTMYELSAPLAYDLARRSLVACEDADMLLFTTLGLLGAPSIGELLNIPIAGIFPQPVTPSSEYPIILAPELPENMPFRTVYNRLTHTLTYQILGLFYQGLVNDVRRDICQLPPFKLSFRELLSTSLPFLYGYSPEVVPRPSDWDEHVTVTGYWFLDEADWTPPADLIDFIEADTPPIYIGFGSMTTRNPQQTTEIILEAVAKAGCRCVLMSGWAGIGQAELPDTVFKIDSAPHAWLFPRMSAVVHHGGAGTTAAGLRAGVPSILVPHFADQPFWGRRVSGLGVGPKPIMRGQLTAHRLAGAITEALTNETMRAKAQALGSRIRAEDGIHNAVQVIEKIGAQGFQDLW